MDSIPWDENHHEKTPFGRNMFVIFPNHGTSKSKSSNSPKPFMILKVKILVHSPKLTARTCKIFQPRCFRCELLVSGRVIICFCPIFAENDHFLTVGICKPS